MRRKYFLHSNRTVIGTGLLLLLTGPVVAQQATAVAGCADGWSTLGSIGIEEFSCDCTFDRSPRQQSARFRSEPVIKRVTEGGTADGKLRAGDAIVAIDGLLITTRAGGDRMSSLKPNQVVVLTVRRNGREIDVELRAGEPCDAPELASIPTPRAPMDAPTARASAPRQATAPAVPTRLPSPPAVASAPSAAMPVLTPPPSQPMGWFGFGINCHDCSISTRNQRQIEELESQLQSTLRSDGPSERAQSLRANLDALSRASRTWRFGQYPTIYSVDPGSPAEKAGLRRGDVLLAIDGVSLLDDEGGERFGAVEAGQAVTWTYRRGNATRTTRGVAIDPPNQAEAASLRARVEDLAAEVERLHSLDAGASSENLAALRSKLDEAQRVEGMRLSELATENQEQHLRFAGMVGNTNVEVRGLGSVDVSFDNTTGELLIHTIDATIRMKAPVRR